MRKICVIIGLCLVISGLGVCLLLGHATEQYATDYEIARMHAEKVYGGDDYEIIILEDTNDENIHYEYRKGYVRFSKWIDRDANYDILTGRYDDVHD